MRLRALEKVLVNTRSFISTSKESCGCFLGTGRAPWGEREGAGHGGYGEEASCEDKPGEGLQPGPQTGREEGGSGLQRSKPVVSNACMIDNGYLSDIINCIFPKFNIAQRGKSFCLVKPLLPHSDSEPARFNCCDKNHKKDQVLTQSITTSTEE